MSLKFGAVDTRKFANFGRLVICSGQILNSEKNNIFHFAYLVRRLISFAVKPFKSSKLNILRAICKKISCVRVCVCVKFGVCACVRATVLSE